MNVSSRFYRASCVPGSHFPGGKSLNFIARIQNRQITFLNFNKLGVLIGAHVSVYMCSVLPVWSVYTCSVLPVCTRVVCYLCGVRTRSVLPVCTRVVCYLCVHV